MADYNLTTWVENVTKTGPTNLNKMEAGIQDAAQHHKTFTLATLPTPAPANKNWLAFVTDVGATLLSDGSQWICIGNAPVRLATNAVFPTANLVDGMEVILPATDRTTGVASVYGVDQRFKYNAADGYWYFQGGGPLELLKTNNVGAVTSTSYTSTGGSGTLGKITLSALQGDFDIEVFSQQPFVDTNQAYGSLNYSVDGGTTTPDDGYSFVVRAESTNNGAKTMSFQRRRTITPAAGAKAVLQVMAKVTSGQFFANGNGASPYGLRIWPVRVKNS